MCGIAGWVSTLPSRFTDADRVLTRMRDRLTHRGPDDAGNFFDLPNDIERRGGAALGFRRLSIIDLSGGRQPIGNEAGGLPGVDGPALTAFRTRSIPASLPTAIFST